MKFFVILIKSESKIIISNISIRYTFHLLGSKMKLMITMLFIMVGLSHTFSQEKVLDHLNQDSCNYKFYFLDARVEMGTNSDFYPHFIIDDRRLIRRFFNDWNYKSKRAYSQGTGMSGFVCGYDYFVYIICNTAIVDKLSINFECKQAVSTGYVIDFDEHPFSDIPTENRFSTFRAICSDIDIARKIVKTAQSKSNLFIPNINHYHWVNHDGSFRVEIQEDSELLMLKGDVLRQRILDILQKKYPTDSFVVRLGRLRGIGLGGGHGYVIIDCSEEFYRRFDSFGKSEWIKFADKNICVDVFGDTDEINKLKKSTLNIQQNQ
ncbi:hypothetical protein CHISP_3470 [Chitinispirillum alkaliphilum]|nr:hypothetical protein CHISP_3470 [Chitinispirillum alkaliphilum]